MTVGEYNIKLLPPTFSPWQPRKPRSRQIAVLMSGGVDSSVTAHLLKDDGWDVLGITMKIPVSRDTGRRGCCGVDAAFVCGELNIPHYFIDITEAFEQLIIYRFSESYGTGATPNPCADCNTLLKFSLVWDFLQRQFGVSQLATGHYAQVTRDNGRVRLSRADDKVKDQSYFLYGITREKLKGLVLPLGKFRKDQVRSIASRINLSVAGKPESMELCFADEGDYRAALGAIRSNQGGDITDMQGNRIGSHKGIANYTLGQRRGVGFAGGKRLYVGRIDVRTNTIALGTREEVSSLTVRAKQLNVLIPEELAVGRRVFGKIRSYGSPQPCVVAEVGDFHLTVEFDGPQFAPCPGQKLVLYDSEDRVIGGGTIGMVYAENAKR